MHRLALFGGPPVLKKPLTPYNSLGPEESRVVRDVMGDGILSDFLGSPDKKFFGGRRVRQFERRVTRMFGVRHAVSFNSATTALQAALMAAGIGPGDHVITSPYTFSATAGAILLVGAIPVFADIDDTLCISAESVTQRITRRTKAIVAVNLFGGMPNYRALRQIASNHRLVLIEDNAQAPGARFDGRWAGTVGDIGVFSFNVHKVIQSGEGGVLVTDNARYAYRAQLVRNHGEGVSGRMPHHVFEPVVGSNFRMSELHAAIAERQLRKLHAVNRQRITLANRLTRALAPFSWIRPVPVSTRTHHVYHMYPMVFHQDQIGIARSTFLAAMEREGFPLGGGYVTPLYLLPIFQKKKIYPHVRFPFEPNAMKGVHYRKGICPTCEWYWEESLVTTDLCQPHRPVSVINAFVDALKKIEMHAPSLVAYERRRATRSRA